MREAATPWRVAASRFFVAAPRSCPPPPNVALGGIVARLLDVAHHGIGTGMGHGTRPRFIRKRPENPIFLSACGEKQTFFAIFAVSMPACVRAVPQHRVGRCREAFVGPTKRQRNSREAFVGPTKRQRNVREAFVGPTKRQRNVREAFVGPTKRQRNSREAFVGPTKRQRKGREAFVGPTKRQKNG